MSRYSIYRMAFEALARINAGPAIRKLSRARGVIWTLHRVLPEAPEAFAPNAILQVTPDFLEAAIIKARESGFDIVDMDEAARRIKAEPPERPFVVLTFDDAYRDNLVHALPVLRRQNAPFTLYVPTALVDGEGEVWWQALEDMVSANNVVVAPGASGPRYMDTGTLEQKERVYGALYAECRAMPEHKRVGMIAEMAADHDLDLAAHCRSLIMDWDELQTFAREPLCTLGAHTVHHFELAKLSAAEARVEIEQSANVLSAAFGVRPVHLSYPIGAKVSAGPREFAIAGDLGFETAVTTRPGGLYATHRQTMTALPRISLNGRFQDPRYLDVFLTGAIFTLQAGRG
ncbi:polysaccharide deacetylase family protein [Pelagibacterium montanilacus]|uniref:polysaccharide deacetylase family protein n=1 Tax=Pelagibacterium montanilacus TaxID=2185280 RepID=UPI000F8C4459|nr:polysaccharide deacetylase family protein [Pelagibacterium montanilacus]